MCIRVGTLFQKILHNQFCTFHNQMFGTVGGVRVYTGYSAGGTLVECRGYTGTVHGYSGTVQGV